MKIEIFIDRAIETTQGINTENAEIAQLPCCEGFPKHTVYQWVTPNGVIFQYVRMPPVETGGYLRKTPTEFGNRGI